MDFYGVETWTLREVDQKHVESFEMWCWRRMEKTSWIDHVKNEKVLQRVKEMDILQTIKRRKGNEIDHILGKNCFLKHVTVRKIQGRIIVTGRRVRRRQKLLDDRNKKRDSWKWKEDALDCTLWGLRFGRGYGPVVRQTAECIRSEVSHFCAQ
jgi:hypothetical protein